MIESIRLTVCGDLEALSRVSRSLAVGSLLNFSESPNFHGALEHEINGLIRLKIKNSDFASLFNNGSPMVRRINRLLLFSIA